MLGYIIATDKNDVVFLDGDEVFKLHLHDMIQKEMHMSEDDSASTSSGIFTDSENGESSKTDSIRARKKSGQVQFNPAEISHVFLPLLSFHRASAESSHDTVENKRKELMNNVELTLETNFGPLMSLCASDLTSVRSGRENMRLIYDLMPQRKGKSLLNVKHTSFYKNQLHEVAPLIQIVSTQLKSAVGTNRCLLLSSGNVLASMSSSAERKGLVDGLSIKDLLFSLDQLPKLPEGLDTATVSQFWLRSKDGVIPHYVNALQYRLTSKLDLLCISETKHNELIQSFRITKDLKEISRTVSDLQSMIVREKSYGGAVPAAFMKNPTRLSSFIQTIWEQIEFELKRKSNELWQNNNGMSRLSLGSLRSVISNLSMTSSAFSKSTHRNKVCSTKADVLIAYARRQVVTIIHELLSSEATVVFILAPLLLATSH
ncbi:unnamed protein product [Caenorhabditis auriculariae]|uniref:Uncharacterized protein n=1 Tax=Caenorhabditis auriculariae TaxID=2777116 RepID=A0A8S1H250_9PELO|nr:unnamed protein product [Caenorhabditis auriculariae]